MGLVQRLADMGVELPGHPGLSKKKLHSMARNRSRFQYWWSD